MQAHVNELEKLLFSSKFIRSSNENISSCDSSFSSTSSSESSQFTTLLSAYDPITVASVLTRVLRKHGPLIPNRLHYLFVQLTETSLDTEASEANHRRALRLLLQLTPSRHLTMIYGPLCQLLLKIASEPLCEVDEASVAVLFAPVLLLDKDASNPVSLANPRLPQVVRLLLDITKREIETSGSLFKVPRLFLHDCGKNLRAHQVSTFS